MATSQMSEVLLHLRRTVLLRDGAGVTDQQLLEDYLSRRDEEALAALVRRHGPMVWCVCRRVLPSHHDAEDAFQATFLVLVRRAASIASRELLANWLYGVAHQTALKARATAARRGGRERQVKEMPEPEPARRDLAHHLAPVLDLELSRLPDKYRIPIVLCDLQGKTRKEAAEELGVPEGTVAGRLARARAMLAKRLARHAPTLSCGALAAALSQQAAAASVPTGVMTSTIKAVTLVAAGQAGAAGISAPVAALAEGVVNGMLLMKLKTAGAVLSVILGLVALGGLLPRQAKAAPEGDEKPAKVAPPAEEAKPDGLAAKQIVDRMAKAYADCKSYQDSGAVKTLFIENGGNRTVEKPFTTAFVRAGRFRFEFRDMVGDQETRFIVWSDGKGVQTWWDVKPGVEKPRSLELALGGAAGVSSNSSLSVPQLLLPDKMGWRRLALAEPKRAKDGKLTNVDCFRVEGTYGGNPITLWIDKKAYLVRRIDEQTTFPGFRTEQTTTYDPVIDKKVADKLLEFDPPAPK
ncbi:MAG: RNA polymerase sigma factor [Gemmataceae bacterium]